MYLFMLAFLMTLTLFIYWIIIKFVGPRSYITDFEHILSMKDKKSEVLKYGHEKK